MRRADDAAQELPSRRLEDGQTAESETTQMTPSKDPARPLPSSRRRFGLAALACHLSVRSALRPTACAMVLPLALAAGVPAWDMARAQAAGAASLVPLTSGGSALAVLRPVARPADLIGPPASASDGGSATTSLAATLARTAADVPAGTAAAVEAPDPESRSLARSVMGVLSTTTAPGRDGVVAAALAVESALNPAPKGVSPAEAVAALTPLRPPRPARGAGRHAGRLVQQARCALPAGGGLSGSGRAPQPVQFPG